MVIKSTPVAATRFLPSGVNATCITSRAKPSSVTSRPDATSHIFTNTIGAVVGEYGSRPSGDTMSARA